MDKVKATIILFLSLFMSWLGILAVPVLLLAGCNVIDYITGLGAAKYREYGGISSYKSIQGITKKVCMWLLVIVGVFMDILIQYTADCTGMELQLPFVAATTVAVWLVVNEIISILENMMDIGVALPPFLMPVVKYIKRQVEDTVDILENGKETKKSVGEEMGRDDSEKANRETGREDSEEADRETRREDSEEADRETGREDSGGMDRECSEEKEDGRDE